MQAPWWVLVFAALAGTGGAAGYQIVVPPRPDPWTSSEAAESHELMMREWRLDLRDVEAGIRRDMPPGPTRARLLALERAVRELHQIEGLDWAPPDTRFSDMSWRDQ
jgi:hypothetical protein